MKPSVLIGAGLIGVAVLAWAALGPRLADPEMPTVVASAADAPGAAVSAKDLDTRPATSLAHRARAQPGSSPPARAAAATVPAPLPPLDTPLLDVLDELEARADAGDAAAACRIAAEVASCDRVQGADLAARERSMATLIARNPQVDPDDDRTVDAFARALEEDRRLMEHCADVPQSWYQRRPYLDLRAAQLGDLDAALRFVHGEGMSQGELVRYPDFALLYRQHAWPLFLRLFESGDAFAPMLWAGAANDPREEHLLSALMPEEWKDRRDFASALARRTMAEVMRGNAPFMADAGDLSPELATEADAFFHSHFAPSRRFTGQQARFEERRMRGGNPEACGDLAERALGATGAADAPAIR